LNRLFESSSGSLNRLPRRFNDSKILAIQATFYVVDSTHESYLNRPRESPNVTHIILRFHEQQILIPRTSNIGDMIWARHDDLPRIEERNLEDGLGRSHLACVGDEADSPDV